MIWVFINNIDDSQDSYNHLNGACSRLLDYSPDNPMLLVLRAFARILLPNYIKTDCINDLRKGFRLFRELKGWSRYEYMKHFSKFYDYIIQFDKSMEGYLDPILLNEHNNWLKEFNKKIIKGVL